MTYLGDQYGKTVLSGQQSQDGAFGLTNAAVWRGTGGDYPAVLGMDLISYSPARVAKGDNSSNVVERAIEYWNGDEGKRGIVTLCWHWCPAARYDKSKSDPWGTFYTDKTKFNLARAMNGRDPDGYQMLLDDIDAIAVQLKRLQDADVPVLWRPLHEASGAWFWWGLQGRDSATNEVFQKLWYMIYDRLENYHKLTNIIWVWNGQNPHTAIHPNAFDIEGIDRYYDQEDISAEALSTYYEKCYGELAGYDKYCAELAGMESTGKMMALTECGYIPDPEGIKAANTMWLYYMVWNGDFIYETDAAGKAMVDLNGTPHPNPKKGITNEMLAEYFSNDLYITHNKLPEFSFGVREIPQQIKNWEYFRIG